VVAMHQIVDPPKPLLEGTAGAGFVAAAAG
jgi:hypothetical protein